uniref:Uncharacterized protein n=1 Tax=Pristionchus pacificus TaxID=54126 RepID=A0A2A6CV17_PRIPA|eukprot:PDM82072.1 hypothetical protein PRIPAC_36465 [Pristionchus pacificus]
MPNGLYGRAPKPNQYRSPTVSTTTPSVGGSSDATLFTRCPPSMATVDELLSKSCAYSESLLNVISSSVVEPPAHVVLRVSLQYRNSVKYEKASVKEA